MLPRVYPITDRTLSGLSHADQLTRLIDGGATFIQLREKLLPADDFLREAESALKIAEKNHVTVIINDRVDIAMAVGASGVHLGQNDLPPDVARRLVSESTLIGFSTHTLPQIEMAVRLPIDYLAFGPVFSTSTKTDHEPKVGIIQLTEAKNTIGQLPLVAIGGINAHNIRSVLEAGADAVAVISAIVAEPSKISKNMQRMLKLAAI